MTAPPSIASLATTLDALLEAVSPELRDSIGQEVMQVLLRRLGPAWAIGQLPSTRELIDLAGDVLEEKKFGPEGEKR